MHFRKLVTLKFCIFFILSFVDLKANTLFFDISNIKVILGEEKNAVDFTIYGFSDAKRTLVLKITGPKQKVILQKKRVSWECGLGVKLENFNIRV